MRRAVSYLNNPTMYGSRRCAAPLCNSPMSSGAVPRRVTAGRLRTPGIGGLAVEWVSIHFDILSRPGGPKMDSAAVMVVLVVVLVYLLLMMIIGIQAVQLSTAERLNQQALDRLQSCRCNVPLSESPRRPRFLCRLMRLLPGRYPR